MEAGKFLDLVIGKRVTDKNLDKVSVVMRVISDYMEGMPLSLCLEKHGLNYVIFSHILKENNDLFDVFQEAKHFNKGALKERLISIIYEGAQHNTKDAKWLLERLYPEEFGKQTKQIIETATSEHPEAINDFINADYEPVNNDEDEV